MGWGSEYKNKDSYNEVTDKRILIVIGILIAIGIQIGVVIGIKIKIKIRV
jgi:hypothetical protein